MTAKRISTYVDPETNDTANLVCDFEETGEDTADGGDRQFSDVGRDCSRDTTTSDASKGATRVCVTSLSWSLLQDRIRRELTYR